MRHCPNHCFVLFVRMIGIALISAAHGTDFQLRATALFKVCALLQGRVWSRHERPGHVLRATKKSKQQDVDAYLEDLQEAASEQSGSHIKSAPAHGLAGPVSRLLETCATWMRNS